MVNGFNGNFWHFLDDTELSNAVAYGNLALSQGVGRELPDVIIARVCIVNDTHRVGHDNAIAFECGRTRKKMRLISIWELTRESQWDKERGILWVRDIDSGLDVNPVALAL
jgi:hypothetical protein